VQSEGELANLHYALFTLHFALFRPESLRGLLVVTIHPLEKPSATARSRRAKKAKAQQGRVEELEQELQYVKETLQTTIEELETSNEELKSTNEELQSTNEELQSSNEELETSKEEMQSLNEELSTVNAELQAKVDELSRTTDDMQNLLNSTQVATVFLDSDLCVKRYTEQARGLFNLIQTDVGRPLAHLTSNFQYDRLLEDCREVLRTLVPEETEVRGQDDSWYLMRIMPYRTSENIIDGVVFTFMETTRVRKAELEAAAIPCCFEKIVRTAREPMLLLDQQLRVAAANRSLGDVLGITEQEAAGKPIYEAANGRLDVPALRGLLDGIVGDNAAPVVDFKLDDEFPGIGRRVLLVNAHRLDRGPDGPVMAIVSLDDATPKE
jgi:two-component system CheB/CheR fusion protein